MVVSRDLNVSCADVRSLARLPYSDRAAQTLAILSATCGYLFVEHHALFMTHYLMAEGLMTEARYLEGAYHAHEAIVTGFAIANRCGALESRG